MQRAANMELLLETQPMFLVYRAGLLIGTVNAEDEQEAKQACAENYGFLNWRDLTAIEVLRS